jgi:hypothetical protein
MNINEMNEGELVAHKTSLEAGAVEDFKTVFSTAAGGRDIRTGFVVVSFGFNQRDTISCKCLKPWEEE